MQIANYFAIKETSVLQLATLLHPKMLQYKS